MLILTAFSSLILTQVFADSVADDFEEPKIISLSTDKTQYTDKDLIKITGQVSTLDSSTVLVGVYDPFGMPTGFYIVPIDSELEFTTSFPVKAGVNFRIDGTYSIKAHYAEKKVTSFFDYYEISQHVIEETVVETVVDTIEETALDTVMDTIEETVVDTVIDTIEENVVDTVMYTIEETALDTIEETVMDTMMDTIEETVVDIIEEKTLEPSNEIKKQTHLTVEDIELGKLLNQINLKCDSSTFTDTISYYDGMGPALYRLCKFDSSLNFFNDSLVENPNDVEILVNKGSALGKLGNFSEAIVYYNQAINIDSNFLPAKNNKANALANLGNFDEAISLYNEILEKNPNYTTARKKLRSKTK